jgi:hypothetical protein
VPDPIADTAAFDTFFERYLEGETT